MGATLTTTTARLSSQAAKRDAELTRRFAAIGLTLHAVRVYKYSSDPTSYHLEFTDDAREDAAVMCADRGNWTAHTVRARGFDMLDELTGDPAMLAYLCHWARHNAYESPLNRKHASDPDRWGRVDGPPEILARAQKDYERAAVARAYLDFGYRSGSAAESEETIMNGYKTARLRLAEAVARIKARDAEWAERCPAVPDPVPYDGSYARQQDPEYRAAQERKSRFYSAQR